LSPVVAFLIILALPGLRCSASNTSEDDAAATAPLGMESLTPGPHGQPFAIYASAEGVELSRLQLRWMFGAKAAGQPELTTTFPTRLSFRVTATTFGVTEDGTPPAMIDSDEDVAKLLASLQFRLRVSEGGLRTERLAPADVHMIGVPADVPYGERIYRVTFQSKPLPASTRMVLEVSAADGELLCKFPLAAN
jgi:hypothetical protein